MELGDQIIVDPNLQVLLNENREVIVGDYLYKYTEEGLYKTSLSRKFSAPGTSNNNTEFIPLDLSSTIENDYSQVEQTNDEIKFSSVQKNSSLSNRLSFSTTQNFSYSTAGKHSLLDKAFGINHTTYVWGPDRRRLKVRVWDRNWFFFSSKGYEVRWQRYKKIWRWRFYIKSYPDKIALGVNSMNYNVNNPFPFNWDAFNSTENPFYNRHRTEYNFEGVKYNYFGNIIPNPTHYKFALDPILGSDNFVLRAINKSFSRFNPYGVVSKHNLQKYYSSKDAYKDINKQVNSTLLNARKYLTKLRNKENEKGKSPSLELTTVYPNRVSHTLGNVQVMRNRDNSIYKVLDWSVLVSLKYGGNSGWEFKPLRPLNIIEIKSFDIYGAAYYKGKWYGKRIIGYN